MMWTFGPIADPRDIDPRVPEIENPFQGPSGPIDLSWEWYHPERLQVCPVLEPQSSRWQEHAFVNTPGRFTLQFEAYELARFFVPSGEQGMISKIETHLVVVDQDFQPIPVDGGLDPFAYEIAAGYTDPNILEFHLRLQSWVIGQHLPAGPEIVADQSSLPGIAHPSLGSWPDARYDYARRDNHVSITVPEGHIIRLFAQTRIAPRPDCPFLVWGRLAGTTQSYRYNDDAVHQARAWR
jgi:hypothetical protein